ncbi:MAG: helix-turn-helix transcriptional regulator [Bacilli bacterium]|nr:helix-turn-helix transcriptional regulator [Bacilli bacterium]
MLNLEMIGNKIADLRRKHDMKQNELADALYVTHQAVSKWENGKSIPSIEILYEITKLFQVSIDYLLEDTEIKEDDYETQLKLFPRDSVIRKFMNQTHPDFSQIFYLLDTLERKQVLESALRNKPQEFLDSYWHLLSNEERIYVLGIIKSKADSIDLSTIYHQLSMEEKRLMHLDFGKGTIHVNFNQKRRK